MLYHLLFVTIQWVGGREQQVENISTDLFRGQSQSSPGVWRNGNTVVGLESTFCSSWCPGPHAAALFPRSFVKSRSCQILPYALNRITHQDCLPPRAAVDIEEINYTNVPFKQWSYANAVPIETLIVSCKCSALMKSSWITDALMWIICWLFQSNNWHGPFPTGGEEALGRKAQGTRVLSCKNRCGRGWEESHSCPEREGNHQITQRGYLKE